MTCTPIALIAVAMATLLVACGQEATETAQVEAPVEPAPAPAPPPPPAPVAGVPDYVSAAVADAGRPAEQTANDAARMPAEVVAFSGMMPGDVVVDFRPGGGYYTRIFSKVVGPEGKVYAVESAERVADGRMDRVEAVQAIAADPAYMNVEVVTPPFAALDEIGEPIDIVWLSNNYHDVVNAETPEGMVPFNEGVFRALRPGGIYLIVDHAAMRGTGYAETDTAHRIDPDVLIADITAVGFELEEESDMLARPEDPRTDMSSFESAQVILKFRKPE